MAKSAHGFCQDVFCWCVFWSYNTENRKHCLEQESDLLNYYPEILSHPLVLIQLRMPGPVGDQGHRKLALGPAGQFVTNQNQNCDLCWSGEWDKVATFQPNSCSCLSLKALCNLLVLTTLHYSSNTVWGNSKHTDCRSEMWVASCSFRGHLSPWQKKGGRTALFLALFLSCSSVYERDKTSFELSTYKSNSSGKWPCHGPRLGEWWNYK